MPQNDVLESMYGSQYEASFGTDSGIDDPKEPCRVLDWLEKLRPGTFVDYGCGGGDLLTEAAKRNWNVVGVEFDEELACSTSRRTGLSVVTRIDQRLTLPLADVLHLGDVIGALDRGQRANPKHSKPNQAGWKFCCARTTREQHKSFHLCVAESKTAHAQPACPDGAVSCDARNPWWTASPLQPFRSRGD
jgi:SAM-dependent methyltransferase